MTITNTNKMIFLFALIQGTFFSSLILKSEKQSLDNLKCLPKLVGMFIEDASSDLDKPVFATEEHKKICPSLDITCCAVEDLNKAANSFLTGFYEMEKVRVLVEGAYQWFDEITIEEAEAVVKEVNPMDIETHEEYANLLANFKSDWKTMVEKKSEILDDLKAFSLAIRKYYAGFICEMCHQRTAQLIINNNNLSADKETVSAPFSFTSYITSVKLLDSMFHLIAKHASHYRIVKSLEIKDISETFEVLFKDQKSIKSMINTCLAVPNAVGLNEKETEECVEIAWQFGHPVAYSSSLSAIVTFYGNFIGFLAEKFRYNPRAIIPENIEKDIAFCYLGKYKNQENRDIIKFYPIVDTNGFDLTKNVLSEEFWNSSALKSDLL